MTKAEIKRLSSLPKLKIRRGDRVQIVAGKDKGEVGYVYSVDPKSNRAIVLKTNDEEPDQPLPLNAVIKHRKARRQGERSMRLRIPAPIDVSNLMLIDPKTGEPTRVGRRRNSEGKLERYAKKSGETIQDTPLPHE